MLQATLRILVLRIFLQLLFERPLLFPQLLQLARLLLAPRLLFPLIFLLLSLPLRIVFVLGLGVFVRPRQRPRRLLERLRQCLLVLLRLRPARPIQRLLRQLLQLFLRLLQVLFDHGLRQLFGELGLAQLTARFAQPLLQLFEGAVLTLHQPLLQLREAIEGLFARQLTALDLGQQLLHLL